MKVANGLVENYYNNLPNSTFIRGAQNSGNDFAGLLNFVANQSISKKQATPANIKQSELSPASISDIYKSMTMQATPGNERNSKEVLGVNWTDEKLAILTGAKYGVTVDTTKTINWQSTGNHTLTTDEISELKEKYDVENLSPQSYYDLMSDLTHMNAISAEDIHGMHLKTVPPSGMYPSSGSAFGGRSFTSGNIFDAIRDDLDSMSNLTGFMMSNDFWLFNPNTNKNHYNGYMDYVQSRTNSMNKLSGIFSDIKR